MTTIAAAGLLDWGNYTMVVVFSDTMVERKESCGAGAT